MFSRAILFLSAILAAAALSAAPVRAAEEIAIGAGEKGGPYYDFGRSICRLIGRKAQGLSCSLLPSTRGDAPDDSLANLVNVNNGAADFGLARSDWHYFAVTGTGPVKHLNYRLEGIRSLFSIHVQPITLVARRDAGIGSLDDLKGKRVNIGRAYTDDRRSVELVMGAKKWTRKDFLLVDELSQADQRLAFCHDRVQAMFYVGSHPNAAISQTVKLCDATLVNVSGDAIDKIVAAKPYLVHATIEPGTYDGISEPVKTFGSTVTVVSSADVSEELVYSFVKAVFDNLPALKNSHSALRNLDPAQMVGSGLTAPYHIGAIRYYREKGLLR
ncbi:MAG: TAXI family TRAP transporter solute-binding subunit [Methyloligellaceae bacterium]